MSITIHLQLLSGEIIPFETRGRNGRIKFWTIRDRLSQAVLDHLGLTAETHYIKYMHDDDEERARELYLEHVNKKRRRDGRPEATMDEVERNLASQPLLKEEFITLVLQKRVYSDGAVIHVMAKEFAALRAQQ